MTRTKTSKYLLAIGFSLAAIAGYFIVSRRLSAPRFIHHPAPPTKPIESSLTNEKCSQEQLESDGCVPSPELAAIGCDRMFMPADYIGALFAPHPSVRCLVSLRDDDSKPVKALYRTGGMAPIYVRYAVLKFTGWQILKTADHFRMALAPITTKDQALGFAAALTGYSAYFDQSFDWRTKYATSTIEDSYVQEFPDHFRVLLFKHETFGCGPHWTYSVEIELTKSGEIHETSRKNLYHNTIEDQLCVD